MNRPKIMITNYDRSGNIIEGWQVRVGSVSRFMDEAEWKAEGAAWINSQLVSG